MALPLILGGIAAAGTIGSGIAQGIGANSAAKTQADAALAAAELQAQSTREQINALNSARRQQRADLQPFTNFGAGFIDDANSAVAQSQQLFNDPISIMENPMFRAIQAQNQNAIMQNAALRGRLGSGGTAQALQEGALTTGFDILNRERQARMANVGMLQGLVSQGQNAAAGQGAASMQSGMNIANALQTGTLNQNQWNTDAAAAIAAGKIGVGNAISGTIQGLGSAAATALTPIPKVPATGGGTLQSPAVIDPFQF